MVFIVSKLEVVKNTVKIIDIGKDSSAFSFHVAYMALLDDCNEYIENASQYSVKNISQRRIEITFKNIFSSYLVYVYEIHDSDEDKDE